MSRSYQQRPERLPRDQSVKELSTKARAPTEGPEHQGIIITLSSYKTREGGDKKKLERYTTRNNVRHGVSTVRLLYIPTEGPERQEVINKGQSAYRRTKASRSYQQRPECLLKDQSGKKLSAKDRCAELERTTNDRQDGNHTRIGRFYAMAVPMNISSHREVGDLAEEKEKGERDPYQNKKECKR